MSKKYIKENKIKGARMKQLKEGNKLKEKELPRTFPDSGFTTT